MRIQNSDSYRTKRNRDVKINYKSSLSIWLQPIARHIVTILYLPFIIAYILERNASHAKGHPEAKIT